VVIQLQQKDTSGARKGKPETLDKLKEIVEALTEQSEIVSENRSLWLQYVLDIQKEMKFRIDIFRSLEDEINLEKKVVSDIIEADPTGDTHIPDSISELHESALTTLEAIEKMKESSDMNVIQEIQTAHSRFKISLLEYIQYLDSKLGSLGGKGLEALQTILEDVDSLESLMPYVIKSSN